MLQKNIKRNPSGEGHKRDEGISAICCHLSERHPTHRQERHTKVRRYSAKYTGNLNKVKNAEGPKTRFHALHRYIHKGAVKHTESDSNRSVEKKKKTESKL